MTKYNNDVIWYDLVNNKVTTKRVNDNQIKFDSKWEFSTYKALRMRYGHKRIVLQLPIIIKPKTKVYSAISYVADFAVLKQGETEIKDENVLMLVEAKGFETDVWKLKLKLLEYHCPELWRRLVVVYPAAHQLDKAVKSFGGITAFNLYISMVNG